MITKPTAVRRAHAHWIRASWIAGLFIVALASWTLYLIQMDATVFNDPEASEMQKWTTWVGVPLAGLLLVLLSQWGLTAFATSRGEAKAEARQAAEQRNVTSLAGQDPRQYVLEVIGLGVSLDKHRQGRLWDALQKGSPFTTIREMDPEKYPYSATDKLGNEGAADASALENGIRGLPMYWPAPSFYATEPSPDPERPPSDTDPVIGIVAGTDSNGLGQTLFIPAGYTLSDHPDRLLEKAFAFFDAHPDVPYLVVAANDGLYFRYLRGPDLEPPLVRDGHYIPEMPGSSALFVLARRERVEALRPFAFDDTDRDVLGREQNRTGLARRLFLTHLRLSRQLGQAMGEVRGMKVSSRWPTVPEWLAAAKAFAQRPDVVGSKSVSLLDVADDVVHVPKGYVPSPWFPIPWNRDQLETFDRLPTLGYLHRPTYIKLTDADGQPLARRSERIAALVKGWNQALETLPEAQRKAALKRVISSTGGSTDTLVELTALLDAQAEAGGPALHLDKPREWINLEPRLGNTGSASWFMGMAIGVMGSYIDGGVSAAINLRNDREASLIFISPPPPEKIEQQGRGVFKNQVTPAIDPANYR